MTHPGSLASGLPRWAVIKDARRRQRRRHRRQAIILAVLAAISVGWLTQRSDAGLRLSHATAPTRSAEIGGDVLETQAAGPRIWVLTCVRLCGAADTGRDVEQLVEVDANSHLVSRRLPLADASAFTVVAGSVWIAHFVSGRITRINPANGRITASLRLRLPVAIAPGVRQFLPVSLSASGGYVWASTSRGWIAKIDPETGKLVRMIRTPSEETSTTTDRYGTWVAEDLDGFGILAPHARRLRIHTIMQAGLPLDVYNVLDGGSVIWALASPDDVSGTQTVVLEINARTHRLIRRVQISHARGAAVLSGALYVGDLAHARIYQVGRHGALKVFNTPMHLATLATASAGVLWASTTTRPGRLLSIRLAGLSA